MEWVVILVYLIMPLPLHQLQFSGQAMGDRKENSISRRNKQASVYASYANA